MSSSRLRRLAAPTLVLLLGFAAAGCAQDYDDGEAGPELPPASSMSMDMSLFGTSTKSQALGGGKEPGDAPRANFNNAVLRLGWLNWTIGKALVAPAATLAAALSVEPTFVDGHWIWEEPDRNTPLPPLTRLSG